MILETFRKTTINIRELGFYIVNCHLRFYLIKPEDLLDLQENKKMRSR